MAIVWDRLDIGDTTVGLALGPVGGSFTLQSGAVLTGLSALLHDFARNDNGLLDTFSGTLGWGISDSNGLLFSGQGSPTFTDTNQDFSSYDIVRVDLTFTSPVALAAGTYTLILNENALNSSSDGSYVFWLAHWLDYSKTAFSLTANDAPTGAPTASLAEGTEDTSYTVKASDLLKGFTDANGDTLSVSGLTASNGTVVDNGDGTFTVTPAADFNGTMTLTYGVTDGKETLSGQTRSFSVTPENDAPTATGVPGDVAVTRDVASAVDLSAITISDADAGSSSITVTLQASTGILTATSGAGVTVGGSGTGTLTLEGTVADLNAFLDTASNVQYLGASGAVGNNAATLTVKVTDNGNTGAGGPLESSAVVNLDIQEARSLVVTTLNDVVDAFDGKTSLREAIILANSVADADNDGKANDTITFASGLSGTIRLGDTDGDKATAYDSSLGQLSVTQELTIDGDGRITITGDRAGDDITQAVTGITDIAASKAAGTLSDNVSLITSGTDLLVLDGLTLTGGVASDGPGGAVNSHILHLVDSTLAGNSARNGGGAIAWDVMEVRGSTIADNSSVEGNGGGLYAQNSLTVVNSTLSGNSSNHPGNGKGGGAYVDGTLTVSNTTVANNTALYGGGVFSNNNLVVSSSTITGNAASIAGSGAVGYHVTTTNSIVLGNAAPGLIDLVAPMSLTRNGGNILGKDVFSGSTDVGDTSASAVFAETKDIGGGVMAGVLASNGGPVQTVALLASATNPAIDASNTSAPATDATGQAPVDIANVGNSGTGTSTRDLGAFEVRTQEARSLVVTTLNDVVDAFDGKTSLREAILFANSVADADNDGKANDTITFASGLSGTIRLGDIDGDKATAYDSSLGQLSVTQELTIDGDGRITITGDRAGDDITQAVTGITDIAASKAAGTLSDNVRLVADSSHKLVLDGLTLTGGVVGSDFGGAVRSDNVLHLLDTTLAGNSAGLRGGGAYVAGTVEVRGSTIAGNSAGTDGGGLESHHLTAENSTFSGNSSAWSGGGAWANSTMTLTNVTVANNTASAGAGVYATSQIVMNSSTVTGNTASQFAGGVHGSQVTTTNSIVVGNAAPSAADVSAGFSLTRNGGNILGKDVFSGSTDVGDTTASAVFAETKDIGGGVLAGVLASNGGPVQTVALLASATNPALDASNSSAPANDARGTGSIDQTAVTNVNGGARDLGAFELTFVNVAPTGQNATLTVLEDETLGFTAADFGFSDANPGDTLQAVRIDTLPAAGTLKLDGIAVADDQVIAAADLGKLTFTPAANANGTGYASFTVSVSDGTAFATTPSTLTINVTPVNDAPTGPVIITGDAVQGATLTASNTIVDVDGLGQITYTWFRDGDPTNVTGTTYTLTQADVGKPITVVARYTDGFGTAEAVTSLPTAPVANVNDAATIGGTTSVAVTEDAAVTTASGQLTIQDVDSAAEAAFVPQTKAGTFGSLAITTAGLWTYTLDNAAAGLATLDTGQTATDTLSVQSVDGTTQTITITINGADEAGPAFTIIGTVRNDKLNGTAGDDRINALAGNDSVRAGVGNDLVVADTGNDTVYGGSGNDTVYGGAGSDKLYGEAGNDRLFGEDSQDSLDGGDGDDYLDGGRSDNSIKGGNGNDVLLGGDEQDKLDGGKGNDRLFGGTGNDDLNGGTENDVLHGEDGNDKLEGGAGNDFLFGGDGTDILFGSAGRDILNGGAGNDRLTGGSDADIFVFGLDFGLDVITDFSQSAGDKIDLTAFGITTQDFASRVSILTNAAKQAVITIDGDATDVITVTNFSSLKMGDFMLS